MNLWQGELESCSLPGHTGRGEIKREERVYLRTWKVKR